VRLPALVRSTSVRRDNRFRVTVLLDGTGVAAHLADPGRLTELLRPGVGLWVAPARREGRVTAHDVWLAGHGNVLVSLNTRVPNAVFEEALRTGALMGRRYPNIQREVTLGGSRLDFLLTGDGGVCWVEVKSVTLVEDGVALFPDAPTARGRRHVLELVRAAPRGDRAAVVFIAQRPDPVAFRPHRALDPDLADALLYASARGVALHALAYDVTLREIRVARELPVRLPG